MKFTRRQTLAAALGSLGAGVLPRAQAQTQPFPSQVIKFVIPTPAGGGHDTMMKIIGQKLTDAWGQPLSNDCSANQLRGCIGRNYLDSTSCVGKPNRRC